jgi:hypothetical protein
MQWVRPYPYLVFAPDAGRDGLHSVNETRTPAGDPVRDNNHAIAAGSVQLRCACILHARDRPNYQPYADMIGPPIPGAAIVAGGIKLANQLRKAKNAAGAKQAPMTRGATLRTGADLESKALSRPERIGDPGRGPDVRLI